MFRRFLHSGRTPVRPGKVSPRRSVPSHIQHPHYAQNGGMSRPPPFIPLLDKDGQQRLTAACAVAKEILTFAGTQIEVGRPTDDIDAVVHDEIIRRGAYPSPLNYGGFSKSLCSSVNEVVVHGIPDSRPLEDGDIVNIDISVFYDGYHGDTSATFMVGDVDDRGQALIHLTNEALHAAITECCYPRSDFTSIGALCEKLATRHGFSVVREYTGHGIGQEFHTLPYVLHHRNNERQEMLPGMAFTVEPAICEGSAEIEHWDDNWTVVTKDGGRSAQAEHTVLITDDGVQVLT